jgi:polysaccharide biosynthesis protein PslH
MTNFQHTHPYKLLLLLPFPPRLDAAQGGSRVIAQLVMQLATRHRVALLYLRGSEEPSIEAEVASVCEWVQEVARPDYGSTLWRRWQRRLYFLLGILLGRPMWVVEWDVAAFRKELACRIQSWQPDIIQAEFHIMAQYLLEIPASAAHQLLTMHEPGISSAPYLLGIYPLMGRFIHKFDRWAWRRYERRLLRHLHQIVVFSKEDRQTLESYGEAAALTVVQLGTVMPQTPLNPLGEEPPTLLFVGNFIHPPNVDAALWLVQNIVPLVVKRIPSCNLYLVGNWPPQALRHLASAQVVVTGYVPDVAPYLDRAAVVVAPLRLGGGTRVKVLDTLAAGKALVASSLAIQGLALKDNEHLLIADTEQEIADAIVSLLQNPAQRAALAQHARSWAEEHLSWEPAVQRYEAIFDQLTGRVTGKTVALEAEAVK